MITLTIYTTRNATQNKKSTVFTVLLERRRPDLNRWILVLQTIALPLGYCAIFNSMHKSLIYAVTPTGIEPVLPP